MNNDLISRDDLKKKIEGVVKNEMPIDKKWALGLRYALKLIDNAPTVAPDMAQVIAYESGKASARPQGGWIPVKFRPLTEKEKEDYHDSDFMYDCKIPDDGEEVLVTTSSGYVCTDIFCHDDGYYFESYCEFGEVVAWQPLPEPYKGEDNDNI